MSDQPTGMMLGERPYGVHHERAVSSGSGYHTLMPPASSASEVPRDEERWGISYKPGVVAGKLASMATRRGVAWAAREQAEREAEEEAEAAAAAENEDASMSLSLSMGMGMDMGTSMGMDSTGFASATGRIASTKAKAKAKAKVKAKRAAAAFDIAGSAVLYCGEGIVERELSSTRATATAKDRKRQGQLQGQLPGDN